jgi:hypothetical protein
MSTPAEYQRVKAELDALRAAVGALADEIDRTANECERLMGVYPTDEAMRAARDVNRKRADNIRDLLDHA